MEARGALGSPSRKGCCVVVEGGSGVKGGRRADGAAVGIYLKASSHQAFSLRTSSSSSGADCHIAFELNKCINLMGTSTYVKATGKCASEVPIGAIVGGVVGGVVGLALIIGVTVGLFCFCKKKNAGSSGAPTGMQMSGAAVATPVATAVAMPAAAGKV